LSKAKIGCLFVDTWYIIESIYMSTQTIPTGAIRTHFDPDSGKWLFSIVDAVGITTKTTDPRNYWKVLKNRLKKAQNQLVTKCNQVKMEARDGKFYLTDVADEQIILKIIELISRENIPSLRYWFDEFKDAAGRRPGLVSSFLGRGSQEPAATYPQSADFTEENVKNFSGIESEELMLMVDGYHTNDALVVKAFVAGVDMDDLDISATSKILTIKGKRKIPKYVADENFDTQELSWGNFMREIKLPYDIRVDDIEASESHGLITISLPLINKLESKKIRISSI
jgi:HSP20 family molecular chaperone IbpA